MSFRAVNKPGQPGYQKGMQRHHLLPRQLINSPTLGRLFEGVGRDRIGFDDFRFNGLLLPAMEQASAVLGLPLHRGPHRQYSEVVAERVAQIEREWSRMYATDPEQAGQTALMRMRLLQAALRRSLLRPGRRWLKLNRNDQLDSGVDFSELDAMADTIWSDTE
nr:AHH domain-containing protein [Alteraurantiacibacter aquimixticola]